MKKWIFFILLATFWSCSLNDSGLQPNEINESFEFAVPSDFTWSAVVQDVVLVTIATDSVKTNALDGTLIGLYTEDDKFIDALMIRNGIARFNIHVPSETEKLKLKLSAINSEMDFSPKKRSLLYEISEISTNFSVQPDSDKDGLLDQFDAAPYDSDIAIKAGNTAADDTGWNNFYIFEDLWPSKGDFDFNDVILKTTFSWVRGKDNFITEITGNYSIMQDNPEFGVGFELFEAKGAYLIYPDEVIETINGAEKEQSIPNGFVVSSPSKKLGSASSEFTIRLKNRGLADFVCVPFIYRLGNEQHQIRPFGTPPTRKQEMELFRSGDDDSPVSWERENGYKFKYPLAGKSAFYRTRESLPWAVQFMAKDFVKPAERQSLTASYPEFKTWVETGGIQGKDWYNHPVGH